MNSILRRTLAIGGAILTLVVPVLASAQETHASTITFKLNDNSYFVDGTYNEMDAPPMMVFNRVYVPIRYLANSLGITDEQITFDEATKQIKLAGEKTIELTLDVNKATVDGKEQTLDVSPVSRLSRAYLPARFIAEELGWKVGWDAKNITITITKEPQPVDAMEPVQNQTHDYGLQNTTHLTGISADSLLGDTPTVILLKNAPFAKIALQDGSRTVYFLKDNGAKFKYELDSPIKLKNGEWLISEDHDISVLGMLGNFIGSEIQ